MAPDRLQKAAKLHAMATKGEGPEAEIATRRRDEILDKEGVTLAQFEQMLDPHGAPRMGRPGRQGPPFGGFQWSTFTTGGMDSTMGGMGGMQMDEAFQQMMQRARRHREQQQQDATEQRRRTREQMRRAKRAKYRLNETQEGLLEKAAQEYRKSGVSPQIVQQIAKMAEEMHIVHNGLSRVIDAIESDEDIDIKRTLRSLAIAQRSTSLAVLRLAVMQAMYAGSEELNDDARTFAELFDVD